MKHTWTIEPTDIKKVMAFLDLHGDDLFVRLVTCSWRGCGRNWRGKNPELTVCQVHTAVAAVVRSWWLNGHSCVKLFQAVAEEIRYAQARNASARRSHVKTARHELRQIGIKLTGLKRCKWDTT